MTPPLFFPVALLLSVQSSGPPDEIRARPDDTPYLRQLGAVHFPAGEAMFGDSPTALALAPTGGVVIAGSTLGSLADQNVAPGDTHDVFVARFDARGRLSWISQIGLETARTIPLLDGDARGPGGDSAASEFVDDLAVAPDGSIFVTGRTLGSLGETHAGGNDLFLARFDPTGRLEWLRQIGVETAASLLAPGGSGAAGDASGWEIDAQLVLDPGGGVWVAADTTRSLGEAHGGALHELADVFVARFDADGNLEWLRQLGLASGPTIGFDALHDEHVVAAALHPSGQLLVCASRAIMEAGGLYRQQVLILGFDASGQPLSWTLLRSLYQLELPEALAVDELSGDFYVAGTTRGRLTEANNGANRLDPFVARFDAHQNLRWIRQIGTESAARLGLIDASDDEYVKDLALDRSGNPILAGGTRGSLSELNAGGNDLFVLELRALDGEPLWISQVGQATAGRLGLDASGSEGIQAIAVNASGALQLCGATSGSLVEVSGGAVDAFVGRLTPYGRLE